MSSVARSGERTDELSRAADVLGAGYLPGRSIHRSLFADLPGETECAEICALLDLLMMSVDGILDDYPRHAPGLLAALDPTTLDRRMEPGEGAPPTGAPPPGNPAESDGDDPESDEPSPVLTVRLILAVARAFVARCRRPGRRSGDRQGYAALRRALLQAYSAELESPDTTFDAVDDPARVRVTLRGKSALPFWIFGCVGALTADAFDRFREVQGVVWKVADALWIVDDVVDVELDVLNGLWNYVPLRVAEKREPGYGRALAALAPRDRVERIVSDGGVQEAAGELVATYRSAVRVLRARIGPGTPLETELAGWLSCHARA